MNQETITILTARLHEATKMLKKFTKKANRYSVPFNYSIGAPRMEEREEQTENMWYPGGVRVYTVEVVDVTLSGEKPVVGDFEFLASIEFVGDAGNFVDTVPGVELPVEYRTTDDRCEHCNASRRRKHVFVVRNKATDELVQVGRTCLRDFLGTDDPKWIIQRFKFFRALKDWSDEESWGGLGGGYWCDELRRVLGIALASTRIWGWVSKGQAMNDDRLIPTVSRYWLNDAETDKWNREDQTKLRAEVHADDFSVAEEIVAWVRGMEPGTSDYLWNLKLSFKDDVLTDAKRLGLAVSAVSAWHHHLDKELKRAEQKKLDAESRHKGEIGERLRDLKVRCEMRRGMGDTGWGWSELLKFRDDEGNLYTWFSGSAPSFSIGEDLMIAGTVKAHKDFNGVQETQLTRVSVQEQLVEAA